VKNILMNKTNLVVTLSFQLIESIPTLIEEMLIIYKK